MCIINYVAISFLADSDVSSVIATLAPAQHPRGGFGGGHGQYAHSAGSYAAVLSLAMVGGQEAYHMIDRPKL